MNEEKEKESLDGEILRVEKVLAALKKRREEEEPWVLSEESNGALYRMGNGYFVLSSSDQQVYLISPRDYDKKYNDVHRKMLKKIALFPLMEEYIRARAETGGVDAARLVREMDR